MHSGGVLSLFRVDADDNSGGLLLLLNSGHRWSKVGSHPTEYAHLFHLQLIGDRVNLGKLEGELG